MPALEALGKQVFFDKISSPQRMACVTCHVPENGWTGRVPAINKGQIAIPGADPHTAGNRRPPTAAYASFAPPFGDVPGAPQGCLDEGAAGRRCRGGIFWDGRATGYGISPADVFEAESTLASAYAEYLGPTADQAMGPFANDVEQNVPDGEDYGQPGAQAVCTHVQDARYAPLFALAWGAPIDCEGPAVVTSFKRIAVAISAWEHSTEVNSFSSRRDLAMEADADNTPGVFPLAGLTDEENQGHALFFGKANCSRCHSSGGADPANEPQQLYTDHGFHNLGLPANPDAANFDPNAPDLGLSQHTAPGAGVEHAHASHFRTPTLRNVDKRVGKGVLKSYMHNGYFKSLEEVVHYYNTASAKPFCEGPLSSADAIASDCWPEPETATQATSSRGSTLFGDLGLTPQEESAIVAYMKTLSDQTKVKAPKPYRAPK